MVYLLLYLQLLLFIVLIIYMIIIYCYDYLLLLSLLIYRHYLLLFTAYMHRRFIYCYIYDTKKIEWRNGISSSVYLILSKRKSNGLKKNEMKPVHVKYITICKDLKK